jgi:hypothetical protein
VKLFENQAAETWTTTEILKIEGNPKLLDNLDKTFYNRIF